MKNIKKKYGPPFPHLLQAQQALVLLYAKVAGRPGAGSPALEATQYHRPAQPPSAGEGIWCTVISSINIPVTPLLR